MKKILFISGGWDGHQPEKIVQLFADALQPLGFETEIITALEPLDDLAKSKSYDVIFPCWTMGALSKTQGENLSTAVREGVALAGIHGGMGDAFRGNLNYEWMVGGNFLGHPYVGDYTIRIRDFASPITQGIPATFPYQSEQYYMMVDPSIHILADTEYLYEGRSCNMPIAWIKTWGKGRIFYCALGHDSAEFTPFPLAKQLTIQGILWAANCQ